MSDVPTTGTTGATQQAVSELTEIVHDVPLIVKETKAGYKTTEFWSSVLAAVLPIVAGVPDKFALPLLGVITAAYTLSRGLAKRGVPDVTDPSA